LVAYSHLAKEFAFSAAYSASFFATAVAYFSLQMMTLLALFAALPLVSVASAAEVHGEIQSCSG
jgi:hypothetical protein